LAEETFLQEVPPAACRRTDAGYASCCCERSDDGSSGGYTRAELLPHLADCGRSHLTLVGQVSVAGYHERFVPGARASQRRYLSDDVLLVHV